MNRNKDRPSNPSEWEARALSQEKQQAIIAEVLWQAVKEATNKVCAEFEANTNAHAVSPPPMATTASSRAAGTTTHEKFDWTRDKSIYQQWQVWSTQARHIMDAMEGYTEAAKVHYLQLWLNVDGIDKITH